MVDFLLISNIVRIVRRTGTVTNRFSAGKLAHLGGRSIVPNFHRSFRPGSLVRNSPWAVGLSGDYSLVAQPNYLDCQWYIYLPQMERFRGQKYYTANLNRSVKCVRAPGEAGTRTAYPSRRDQKGRYPPWPFKLAD